MSRYILKTLGCKANLYDSQLIEKDLQNRGWLPEKKRSRKSSQKDEKKSVQNNSPNQSDQSDQSDMIRDTTEEVELCIVNSCSVTDEADRQSRKMAEKLARENKNAVVVVTGCSAEIDPEGLKAALSKKKMEGDALPTLEGARYVVVGNQNKHEFTDLILKKRETQLAPVTLGTAQSYGEITSRHPIDRDWPAAIDSFHTPPTHLEGYSRKTRAFLKIQEGCDAFCTYCIIPYGRGPSRSLDSDQIVKQIHELVGQGIREVVITGTNIGDYQPSPGGNLEDLLKQILEETSLERLRLSSLDPVEITDGILSLMKQEPRLCPHFHVSLQSPHSKILKLMKRKYAFEEVRASLEKISALRTKDMPPGGVYVGMDLITGFPGETEKEFEWTLRALGDLPWTRLHVFPYSERAGTPATRLPGSVPQSERVRRSRVLSELSLSRLKGHYESVLSQCQKENLKLDRVLLENAGEKSGWIGGYTPNYLRILFRTSESSSSNTSDSPFSAINPAPNLLTEATPLELMIDAQAGDIALISQRET